MTYSQIRLLFVIATFSISFTLKAQVKFNGNLEQVDKGKPAGWNMVYLPPRNYKIQLDSVVKMQGKYAVSIAFDSGEVSTGYIDFPLRYSFKGRQLTLTGFIKTENVNGLAGLFIRVDGHEREVLNYVDMDSRGIKGTTDWKQYTIQFGYNEDEVTKFDIGAYLKGTGKIWLDGLSLYVGDKPVEKAALTDYKFSTDTAFAKRSGIDTIIVNENNTNHLALLGQLWGFLKYHHPAVAQGNYNWDAELFRVLPKVISAHSDAEVSEVLEQWVDRLGKPARCSSCAQLADVKNIAVKPDYGNLFDNKVFVESLTDKLRYILANRNVGYSYYVEQTQVGNPKFKHEKAYPDMAYPDAGYRLLALYRYWNIIQYFSPNRELITEGWDKVLSQYIEKLARAEDKTAYAIALVSLTAHIHDSHAFSGNRAFADYAGKFGLPFQAKFIEDKLVVTGYYQDTLGAKEKFRIGDIITSINGVAVTELVKKYLPILPISNYDTQLRDLPAGFLLRNHQPKFSFILLRSDSTVNVNAEGLDIAKINTGPLNNRNISKKAGYCLINEDIGYLYPAMFKREKMNDIKKTFISTKGIIIDMRCYPSDEMVHTIGDYVKPYFSPFIKFTWASPKYPGLFTYTPFTKNGKKSNDNYTGKVVVIVNAQTQSNAEFVTMALQSGPSVTVIGSTTAGADGNISHMMLPGAFSTYISGLGVYYPDGTNAQKVGVKIDEIIRPTIKGIKAGKDELLERAEQIIMGNR